MAERRQNSSRAAGSYPGGYLGRLVEVAGRARESPRESAVHLPRQLAWGPPRAAADELLAAEPEPQDIARSAIRARPAPRVERAGRPAPRSAEPEQDAPSSERAPVRSARLPMPVTPAIPVAPESRGPAPRTAPRATPTTVSQPSPPVPLRPSAPPRTAQPARPEQRAAEVTPPPLAPTVAHALERLAARSLRTPAKDETRAAPPTPRGGEAAEPSRAATPARPVSLPLPIAPQPRRETSREPQVHIGTIEVTIASPAPPAPAFPPPTRRVVATAPAPAGRLSRTLSGYGLGQG